MNATYLTALTTLAITLAAASPAMAQGASGSASSTSERFAVGVDARARTSFPTQNPSVLRASLEFALVEPELGESGSRIDVFGGIGAASGLYLDAGARFGYEFDILDASALTFNYDISLTREEHLRSAGMLTNGTSVDDPVSILHRLGVEVGAQQGARLRLGVGVSETIAHADRGRADASVGLLIADAGFVWRM